MKYERPIKVEKVSLNLSFGEIFNEDIVTTCLLITACLFLITVAATAVYTDLYRRKMRTGAVELDQAGQTNINSIELGRRCVGELSAALNDESLRKTEHNAVAVGTEITTE